MADTIARLIFEANTAQLKKANDELKKLAKESGKSTRAVTEQTTAEKKLAKAKTASDKVQAKIVAAKNKRETQAYAEQIKRDNAAAVSAKKVSEQRAKAAEKASEQVKIASEKAAAAQQKAAQKAAQAQVKEAKKAADIQEKSVVKAAQAQEKASEKAAARIRMLAKAEIAAYKEAERLEKAANKASGAVNKLGKTNNKTENATEKLAKSFRNASTATAALQGPLNGLSGRLSFIATGLGRIGVKGLGVSAAFVGMVFAVRNSLKVFQEYELQMLKVEALVKSTGGTAGFTSKQLNEMAVGLATATMASANEMRNAQGVLLTFKAISGDVFESALGLTVDIGAAMGQTATSGAKQLGKALEDPARNMTGLTRAGISFTKQEKERITVLQKSGDLQGAQAIIIKTLQDQLGGAGTGGGLSGAADLAADNFERLNIAIADEFGFANIATKATLGLANALGILADKITETPEEELARLLGTEAEPTRKTVGGRTQNVNLTKPDEEVKEKGVSTNVGGRTQDKGDPVQKRIKELQGILAAEEKAQADVKAAAAAKQAEIEAEALTEMELVRSRLKAKEDLIKESRMREEGDILLADDLRLENAYAQAELEYEAQVLKYGKLDELSAIRSCLLYTSDAADE